jgi:hypothetical protein
MTISNTATHPTTTPTEQPDAELLLHCARIALGTSTIQSINHHLQNDIDWQALIQLAIYHKVLPLLYQSLNTIQLNAIPQSTLAALRTLNQQNTFRNLFLSQELGRLLQVFSTQNLPVIQYKGPSLAVLIYGDLAFRQFTDLDLLVDPKAIETATQLLVSQGYERIRQFSGEIHFWHPQRKVSVDLHEAIIPNYFPLHLAFDELWNQRESLSILAHQMPTLSLETYILLFCTQWTKDFCGQTQRLSQLYDLAVVVQRYPQLDWNAMLDFAAHAGCRFMLLAELSLIQTLLGVTLPEPVQAQLQRASSVSAVVQQMQSQFWQRHKRLPSIVHEGTFMSGLWRYNHRLQLALTEHPRDQVIYCWQWLTECLRFAFLPNQRDTHLVKLPAFLSFLYYLLHPIRLIGTYSARFMRHKLKPNIKMEELVQTPPPTSTKSDQISH